MPLDIRFLGENVWISLKRIGKTKERRFARKMHSADSAFFFFQITSASENEGGI
jgi:hypothetical protein